MLLGTATLHVGDVMNGLAQVASGSVQCCVTSPPYWGLRDYGFPGQIGLEKTPEEYVERIVGVFQEVRRTLRDDGTLFVNLGDSYCKDSKYGGMSGSKNEYLRDVTPRGYREAGLTNGNLVGIPWRVALAMQADGWILRQCIVWHKPSPMPESISGWRWVRCRAKIASGIQCHPIVNGLKAHSGDIRNTESPKYTDCPGCDKCRASEGLILKRGSWRPTTGHEFIFQFAKSERYFSDGDTSKEPATTSGRPQKMPDGFSTLSGSHGHIHPNGRESGLINGITPDTRNMRTVWRISAEPCKLAHFATFPTELVRRCLIGSTSRGGCCSACGMSYAPIVETSRFATRPGSNTKVGKRDAAIESGIRPGRPDHPNIVGNRDPQRHTTTTRVIGFRACCSCNALIGRSLVLDPFAGTCRTGQVAIHMGCDFVGCEGSDEYAEIGRQRLETPWVPVGERRPSTKPRRKLCRIQQVLQFEGK